MLLARRGRIRRPNAQLQRRETTVAQLLQLCAAHNGKATEKLYRILKQFFTVTLSYVSLGLRCSSTVSSICYHLHSLRMLQILSVISMTGCKDGYLDGLLVGLVFIGHFDGNIRFLCHILNSLHRSVAISLVFPCYVSTVIGTTFESLF